MKLGVELLSCCCRASFLVSHCHCLTASLTHSHTHILFTLSLFTVSAKYLPSLSIDHSSSRAPRHRLDVKDCTVNHLNTSRTHTHTQTVTLSQSSASPTLYPDMSMDKMHSHIQAIDPILDPLLSIEAYCYVSILTL